MTRNRSISIDYTMVKKPRKTTQLRFYGVTLKETDHHILFSETKDSMEQENKVYKSRRELETKILCLFC